MKHLFWDQLLYLWQIIRYRFLFWGALIGLLIIVQSVLFRANPHFSLYLAWFRGTDYLIKYLPVSWLIYFITPLLIVLNSFQELWHVRGVQLRGQQYSLFNFLTVNLELIGVIAVVFTALAELLMILCTKIFNLQELSIGAFHGLQALLLLFIVNFLGTFLLLVLQALISRYNAPLGIVIPLVLLIITAYTSWPLNPLNSLMILRVGNANIISMLCTIIVVTILYLFSNHWINLD